MAGPSGRASVAARPAHLAFGALSARSAVEVRTWTVLLPGLPLLVTWISLGKAIARWEATDSRLEAITRVEVTWIYLDISITLCRYAIPLHKVSFLAHLETVPVCRAPAQRLGPHQSHSLQAAQSDLEPNNKGCGIASWLDVYFRCGFLKVFFEAPLCAFVF